MVEVTEGGRPSKTFCWVDFFSATHTHTKKKKIIKDHLPSQHILSFFLFVLKCHYFEAAIIICVPLSVSRRVWLCFCSRVPGEGFSRETSGCNLPLTYWSGMLLASALWIKCRSGEFNSPLGGWIESRNLSTFCGLLLPVSRCYLGWRRTRAKLEFALLELFLEPFHICLLGCLCLCYITLFIKPNPGVCFRCEESWREHRGTLTLWKQESLWHLK